MTGGARTIRICGATAARAQDAAAVQLGGNCYAYAMLAAGWLDLVIEADLKPWDVCALAPLVEAAGDVVAGWDGGSAWEATRVVACGDRRLYDEIAPLLAGAPRGGRDPVRRIVPSQNENSCPPAPYNGLCRRADLWAGRARGTWARRRSRARRLRSFSRA